MQITVLSTAVETIPTAKGSYQTLEVAYKDDSGQVKGKKIMSFGAQAPAFKTLSSSQVGESFSITSVKNDKGYWDWTAANKGATTATAVSEAPKAAVRSGSTYETPEERAKKQVYIVRQSSITAALGFLNGKSKSTDEVVQVAKEFEHYVFSVDKPSATQELIDMENDIPQ